MSCLRGNSISDSVSDSDSEGKLLILWTACPLPQHCDLCLSTQTVTLQGSGTAGLHLTRASAGLHVHWLPCPHAHKMHRFCAPERMGFEWNRIPH